MKYISTFAHTEICAALWRNWDDGGAAANMRPSRCLEQALSIWGMLQTRGKNAERKNGKKAKEEIRGKLNPAARGKYAMTQIRAA